MLCSTHPGSTFSFTSRLYLYRCFLMGSFQGVHTSSVQTFLSAYSHSCFTRIVFFPPCYHHYEVKMPLPSGKYHHFPQPLVLPYSSSLFRGVSYLPDKSPALSSPYHRISKLFVVKPFLLQVWPDRMKPRLSKAFWRTLVSFYPLMFSFSPKKKLSLLTLSSLKPTLFQHEAQPFCSMLPLTPISFSPRCFHLPL